MRVETKCSLQQRRAAVPARPRLPAWLEANLAVRRWPKPCQCACGGPSRAIVLFALYCLLLRWAEQSHCAYRDLSRALAPAVARAEPLCLQSAGVNRHEHDPRLGKTVSVASMIQVRLRPAWAPFCLV